MPKSLREGFMQLFGQPPTAILNLWGRVTSAQPVKNVSYRSAQMPCVSALP